MVAPMSWMAGFLWLTAACWFVVFIGWVWHTAYDLGREAERLDQYHKYKVQPFGRYPIILSGEERTPDYWVIYETPDAEGGEQQ